MDGRIVVTRGALYDVVSLLSRAMREAGRGDWIRFLDRARAGLARLKRGHNVLRSRANVATHYYLDRRLYALFLDADLQYSCAYFERPSVSLEEAQLAKRRHIAAKLAIEPGQTVLDIGCGFGGLALYLAQETGAIVRGITLSEEQFSLAKGRADAEGLADRVDIGLEDYRQTAGRYDRIVCRMWELYLCGAECAFHIEGSVNFQLQLCKRVDALPITRGYMAEREEALRRQNGAPPNLRIAGE